MNRIWIAAPLAVFASMQAACADQTAQSPAAASHGCAARAESVWAAEVTDPLSISAVTDGPDCAHAAATITIRNSAGGVMWSEAYATAQVMPLAGVTDVAAMNAALKDWVSAEHPSFGSSADLPPWPQGAEAPQAEGEFPFYADEDLNRANYEQLRAANARCSAMCKAWRALPAWYGRMTA